MNSAIIFSKIEANRSNQFPPHPPKEKYIGFFKRKVAKSVPPVPPVPPSKHVKDI
jgi:hypothetical protein